jgi:hypothetical protein
MEKDLPKELSLHMQALKAQIAAAGLHINFDRDLQCLQLVCDREVSACLVLTSCCIPG